ncbi:type I polyketide synthase [uncultured Corynebacterium sp.]|uniref:type I polyketide synthase n=1 Tax=uncultured Corynebacterium sp. TaxID=159447 RepID=UPI0025FE320F|nr:type I polyketide synthase [uncultured Corynebacterium sp.]
MNPREPFALSFSGQGFSWADSLRGAGADLRATVDQAAQLLEPLAAELAGRRPRGFHPFDWAQQPPAWDLSAPEVSVPGIFLAQLNLLDVLAAQGLELNDAVAVAGHSQGRLAEFALDGLDGTAGRAEMLAIAQLIGAAMTHTARRYGLVRDRAAAPMVAINADPHDIAAALRDTGADTVIGLHNSARDAVLSGPPADNLAVARALGVEARPLKVAAAFHHPHMSEAVEQVVDWAQQVGLDTGLAERAARAVLTDVIDWPAQVGRLVDAGAQWILEIGPEEGVRALTEKIVEGRGIGVLAVGTAKGQARLIDPGHQPAPPRPYRDFAPRTTEGGELVTRFTRLTGYQAVLLAGMTPTTVDPAIVAAAANAGYWAELAGGGQVTDQLLGDNLDYLREHLAPGVNAQFNALYLNPRQWRRQVAGKRQVPTARANGAPVNGIVCSAGIPPLDEAVELYRSLREGNIPWVAFKPGAVRHVDKVLEIARAVAPAPVIMQLEGGLAGGHHSWEDLDELLLATYARIRAAENVYLAVGGGIGTPERGADYLTGAWARAYGRPDMPVDAILVGTAAMATLEATTSPAVKRALVAAAGTEGFIAAGTARAGMSSGRSQLGADIHEVDNSFAQAGRLLDAVAGDADAVRARRAEIISALDATCKPYFGDLTSLTYRRWLERYLELSHRGEWADDSWRARFAQMLLRAEARLHPADHGEFASQLPAGELDAGNLADLLATYPQADTQHVSATDAAWFIELLKGPGKPANFVPVIGEDVRWWWRTDSLWQAHDARYPADAVSIIPSPRSVAGIDRVDEPVAELLGRFVAAAAARAEITCPAASERERILSAPAWDWAGHPVANPARRLGLEVGLDGGFRVPGLGVTVALPEAATVPVVGADSAGEAMRELARRAAGGKLPEVVGKAAAWSTTLNTVDYQTVTAGYLSGESGPAGASGPAADALVGPAWPAIFAVIADTDAVEGLLRLVHLEHAVRLHSELPQHGAQVSAKARLTRDLITARGRVLEVHVGIVSGHQHLATLTERFLIPGTAGADELPALDVTDPAARPTPLLSRGQVAIIAPESMWSFAQVTGDFNPIHTDENLARAAGLSQGPIVHGMWTSALAQLAAGENIVGWHARLLAPVLPGQTVEFSTARTGQAAGGEVRTVTATVGGVPVLEATAQLAAPVTWYAFPGQGIQSPGMGMAAYAASPAARAVWDRADAHTRQALGFSILDIVRRNPHEVQVAGESFSHPDGVLYLTQFTQVAMATLGCAQVAQLREAGVLAEHAFFAGHSVGEYNALAAFADVLSVEAVIEIVYQRGLTMHRLVPRDGDGNSNYGLAALRPHKMGMSDTDVFDYVGQLSAITGEFLEIVNYNVKGKQYAVAGTRAGLRALEADAASRGERAFVLIPGVDVPFHSSRLRDGVDDFRRHLDQLIPADIDLDRLIGRYIPNLVARPFDLGEEFIQAMEEVVDSPWLSVARTQPAQQRGRTLLVELLAWQFTSPVRWIETQDLALGSLGVERFVEIGVASAPTLANMLRQHPGAARVEVLNAERDQAVVFATDADPEPAPEPEPELEPEPDTEPEPVAAPAPAPEQPAATDTPADRPLLASDALRLLVAAWTKVRLDQLRPADTIESLVEGQSSRRNQLLLDISTELGIAAIDGAADLDLASLGELVDRQARGYQAFGPVLQPQVEACLRDLTGPAAQPTSYVSERVRGRWGLGPGWLDRVLAQLVDGTRPGASLRGGDLASLPAGLDAAIDAAAHAAGITTPLPEPAAAAAATADPAALRELTDALTANARDLLERLDPEAASTEGQNDGAGAGGENAGELAQAVDRELGAGWADFVRPAFDPARALLLDDRWASAREDAAQGRGDVTATGEEVARIAEYAGHSELAAAARTDPAGLDYAADCALITGAAPGSIAAAITAELLWGGATVVATSSRLDQARLDFFTRLYRDHARGQAALWVVPCNVASFADVDALADWVGSERTRTVGAEVRLVKPALTPTLLFPFAAPRVAGTLAEAGAGSERQMRLLLWSVERLIAATAEISEHVHVVLPGSPNRGRFGGDGAYGEAKAALDAVENRWRREPAWANRVGLVHAQIGWVRGTGLMGGNDPLVAAAEARGVRTWDTREIAAELLAEGANPAARRAAREEPVAVDLTGGLAAADVDLAALRREASAAVAEAATEPDARVVPALPNLAEAPAPAPEPDFGEVAAGLEEMVVVVGAGELGPWGSARTRFEAELGGDLSAAGVVELAWSMGLIRWEDGWVDAAGEPVAEADIYARFHDEVMASVGVRRLRDDAGISDNLAGELTTVYLDRDLTFSTADADSARDFAAAGARVCPAGDAWEVTRPKGSEIRVPRRTVMTRFVGGQLPDGFDPAAYGIPADMLENLDRLAVWNLICTVEAFTSAGFSPAELLAHVHPARVSNTQGTGMGGVASLRGLYVDRLLGQPRNNDVLQEALPNVIAAHVMQDYVGGYGQMVHPVAACATAAVSVEEAADKLRLGKADFVVAGGVDDMSVESVTGFGAMAATADSAALAAAGIAERYFSRPNDRRRAGFVESAGGGALLLTRGDLAAELGLPVLGVVAFAESFADGAHTSIPAPGLGALSAARDNRLAAALAPYGLDADDVRVISKHDTSTEANDPNESDLHQRLAWASGRTPGNPLYVISQKHLTGHAKGGAAAFQLIGLMQVMRRGIIPPNRALDCVDPQLRRFSDLVWPRTPLPAEIKAGLVTSLGFGHVSALIAVVHPGAFAQALRQAKGEFALNEWRTQAARRERAGRERRDAAMHGQGALYARPTGRNLGGRGADHEAQVLLDPQARLRGGELS